MSSGTVKWFDSKKGFGFLLNTDSKDVFIHFSNIQSDGFRSLTEGDQVEYEQHDGEKGLFATHVKVTVAVPVKPLELERDKMPRRRPPARATKADLPAAGLSP